MFTLKRLNGRAIASLLFQNLEECKEFCQDTAECRYYWWYPIERSEYPLYCYLFRQCGAQEPIL
jgi:hypothetical protein